MRPQVAAHGGLRASHNAQVPLYVRSEAFTRPASRHRRTAAAGLAGLIALLVFAAMPGAARADWTVAAEASLRHDDNVGNGEYPADIIGDSIIGAQLSAFQVFAMSEGYSVSVGGDLAGESFHRISGLSNASLAAVIALKKKWGLGAFAPWVRVAASIARTDYDDDYRSASVYRATAAAGQRIGERWSLRAEYAFESRVATPQEAEAAAISGDVFSQRSNRLSLDAQYALNERTFLEFGSFVRHGDVVSTTESPARLDYAARAIADDPTFGEDAYAYRLTGTTYGLRAGISYSVSAHSLLGCGFQRSETHAEGNVYTKSTPEVTWDYRF